MSVKPRIYPTIDEFNRRGFYCTDGVVHGLFALTPTLAFESFNEQTNLFKSLRK